MINFCLYVFIIYAVASSAKAILLSGNGNKKRNVRKRSVTVQRAPRKNNIIKLNQTTARRGKTPLRVAFYEVTLLQNTAFFAQINMKYTNISYRQAITDYYTLDK